MSRGSFKQADIERLLRAAKKEGAVVQVDLRTLVATIIPIGEDDLGNLKQPVRDLYQAPDGLENWDDFDTSSIVSKPRSKKTKL